jgi:hypothetical protein
MSSVLTETTPFRRSHRAWMVPLLSLLYYFFATVTTGFRGDHLFLVVLCNVLYFLNDHTRRFIMAFSIFVVYWILFDSMKAWPNYRFHSVDIASLFHLEQNLFGINENGQRLIPSQYFALHPIPAIDLVASLFYLCWVPVPLGFAFYLFVTDKKTFLYYCLAFFVINLVGFVVYYTHPAAAPWYVEKYGFVFHPEIKSNAAGLLRADKILGFDLFEGIYSKGSNVFAAMPSLHSAYPLAGFFYSLRQPRRWITYAFVVIMTGIWISAVYLSHHYILDVLAGIACGITGIFICEKIIFRNEFVKRFLDRWRMSIEP